MSAILKDMKKINFWKLGFAIIAGYYFLYPALTTKSWPLLDNANLIFHEAGHFIFMPFGNTVSVLGGSLMQVIVPLIFIIYFFLTSKRLSASLVMMWLGQNLINISVYAGDAMKMQLSLITNDPSMHDWNHLFLTWGCLRQTDSIANVIYIVGLTIIIIAVILSLLFSKKEANRI